jgi:hypothetical protein
VIDQEHGDRPLLQDDKHAARDNSVGLQVGALDRGRSVDGHDPRFLAGAEFREHEVAL